MTGYTCAFRGCRSKTGGGVSLFTFPKDHNRAKLWLKACCRTDLFLKTTEELSNYRLCEHHFEKKFFSAGASRKRLLPNASPTLFPHALKMTCDEKERQQPPSKKISENIIILSNVKEAVPAFAYQETVTDDQTIVSGKVHAGSTEHPLLDIYGPSTSRYTICEPLAVEVSEEPNKSPEHLLSSSTSTQTSSYLSNRTSRKLRMQMRKMRKSTAKRQEQRDLDVGDFNSLCDKYLDEPLSSIIKTHVALKGKNRNSHRYSMELKQFAMKLYFLSPKAYKFISSLLTLPTQRSLQRVTEKIPC